ncbi:hypothetical protein ACFW1F_04455 [Streptomyces bungoensis]|uniref:hypothetical protein n=1 Tax=Streptomyces bungoensis TaxID=285568 RepID=UPI0036903450
MNEETERRVYPKPSDPSKKVQNGESFDHSQDLRQRVTRLTLQLLDHIEETGAVVDGEANPDLDILCALIDSGTRLRRVSLERRLGGAVLEWRARRPLKGDGA